MLGYGVETLNSLFRGRLAGPALDIEWVICPSHLGFRFCAKDFCRPHSLLLTTVN